MRRAPDELGEELEAAPLLAPGPGREHRELPGEGVREERLGVRAGREQRRGEEQQGRQAAVDQHLRGAVNLLVHFTKTP